MVGNGSRKTSDGEVRSKHLSSELLRVPLRLRERSHIQLVPPTIHAMRIASKAAERKMGGTNWGWHQLGMGAIGIHIAVLA